MDETTHNDIDAFAALKNYQEIEQTVAELRKSGVPDSKLEHILDHAFGLLKNSVNNQVTGELGKPAKDLFIKGLEQQISNNKKVYVASMDIDNFKKFNDTYGHRNGDEVLKKVARIARESLRYGEGNAFHVHGEEIELIYFAENDDIAKMIAERVRSNIEEQAVFKFRRGYEEHNEDIPVTVSIGVTEYADHGYETIDQAMERADTLGLAYAKQHGRNKITFVDTYIDIEQDQIGICNPDLYTGNCTTER